MLAGSPTGGEGNNVTEKGEQQVPAEQRSGGAHAVVPPRNEVRWCRKRKIRRADAGAALLIARQASATKSSSAAWRQVR